jgi:hypothetical protein
VSTEVNEDWLALLRVCKQTHCEIVAAIRKHHPVVLVTICLSSDIQTERLLRYTILDNDVKWTIRSLATQNQGIIRVPETSSAMLEHDLHLHVTQSSDAARQSVNVLIVGMPSLNSFARRLGLWHSRASTPNAHYNLVLPQTSSVSLRESRREQEVLQVLSNELSRVGATLCGYQDQANSTLYEYKLRHPRFESSSDFMAAAKLLHEHALAKWLANDVEAAIENMIQLWELASSSWLGRENILQDSKWYMADNRAWTASDVVCHFILNTRIVLAQVQINTAYREMITADSPGPKYEDGMQRAHYHASAAIRELKVVGSGGQSERLAAVEANTVLYLASRALTRRKNCKAAAVAVREASQRLGQGSDMSTLTAAKTSSIRAGDVFLPLPAWRNAL